MINITNLKKINIKIISKFSFLNLYVFLKDKILNYEKFNFKFVKYHIKKI